MGNTLMSQQNQIVVRLREMIMSGALRAGERVAEIPIATRLGVSRTPVRYALGVLAQEGLIIPTDHGRGFVVREFAFKDVRDAIKVRGVLEGMAARLVAERGLSTDTEARLVGCLDRGATLLAAPTPPPGGGPEWADINETFHATLVAAADNAALAHALRINDQAPFASARSYFDDESDPPIARRQFDILRRAQHHHVTIVQCLRDREGARVEALMREHALIAVENVSLFRDAMATLLVADT